MTEEENKELEWLFAIAVHETMKPNAPKHITNNFYEAIIIAKKEISRLELENLTLEENNDWLVDSIELVSSMAKKTNDRWIELAKEVRSKSATDKYHENTVGYPLIKEKAE
jgi:hypothetical protein